MPNHIHGIIEITGQDPIGIQKGRYGFETVEQISLNCEGRDENMGERPVQEWERRGRRSLPGLIKDFKSVTTRLYKREENDLRIESLWQSSYYDEIIRDEDHYGAVWEYIENNPLKWAEDKYYR